MVVVDGIAASGGYIAAMASDRIFAQQSSIVGSIGIIFQYPNFTDLLKTVGVQVESIKSTPLKASPNGLEPTSPEARAARGVDGQGLRTTGSKTWCASGAGFDQSTLDKVADGRVFTGRQALELKLIDALGDEKAAVEWLAKEKGIDPKTPVRDYRLQAAVRRSAVPAHGDGWTARRPGLRGAGGADQGMGRATGGRAAQP